MCVQIIITQMVKSIQGGMNQGSCWQGVYILSILGESERGLGNQTIKYR